MKALRNTLMLAVPFAIALVSFHASAQTKTPFSYTGEGVKSRYIQQLAIDVEDIAGHQVRVQESVREYPESNRATIDGERVVQIRGQGFSNYVSGIGPAWGYNTWTTDKGNKIFVEFSGTSVSRVTETGSKRGTYTGTSKIVGGTGRFGQLRGILSEVTEFDTDPNSGYNRANAKGEYWFEK
jgi:hypothetical protein